MSNEITEILQMTNAAVDKIAELIASRKAGPMAVRVTLHQAANGSVQSEFKFVKLEDRTPEDSVQDMGPFMLYADADAIEIITGAVVDFNENQFAGGFNIQYPNYGPKVEAKKWDDPLAQEVQDAITIKINPALAGHGGWVKLLDVKGDTAYIEMGGGCHGCALSQMTLKTGIERIIKEEVPAIATVLDRTDHAEGKNPYYVGDPAGGQSAL
jgi:Fe/S biogenesis protein NfuA